MQSGYSLKSIKIRILRSGKMKKEIVKGENILKELINIVEPYLGIKDHEEEEFGEKTPPQKCIFSLPPFSL